MVERREVRVWEDMGARVRIGRAAYLNSRDAEQEEELRTARGGPRRVGVRGGHWPPRALTAGAPQANAQATRAQSGVDDASEPTEQPLDQAGTRGPTSSGSIRAPSVPLLNLQHSSSSTQEPPPTCKAMS